jgi:hypothetical protein
MPVKETRRHLAVVLIIAAAMAVLFAVVSLVWDSKRSYIGRNEELLRSLPVYPGARQVAIESQPYYLTESGSADGYGTRATFEVLGVTADELLSFFETNLPPDWTVRREVTPCRNLDTGTPCPSMISLHAVKGAAYISVDPANLNTSLSSYDLYVDHDSYLADPAPATVPPAPTPTFSPVVR